jgi:adenosylmethionine---8-amino-7-oxononanoate aminotransferase
MALGATTATKPVFDAFLSADRTKTFFHGHSFTANPLACAAALASLDLLEDKDCENRRIAIHTQHLDFIKNDLPEINKNAFLNIRVMGTILAFEINTGRHEYTNQAGAEIMQHALSKGIYLRPLGNTVYLMPPYCISRDQLREVYQFLLTIPQLPLLKKN